jgi:hypothetical protein
MASLVLDAFEDGCLLDRRDPAIVTMSCKSGQFKKHVIIIPNSPELPSSMVVGKG